MPKPVVLRTDAELNMGGSWPDEAGDLFQMVTAPDDRPETIARLATDAEIIYTCYAPINAEVIAAASRLKGIVKYGVGVDSIDLDAASTRGIPVAHCPDYGTDTVADQAFALMIGVARKIARIDRDMGERGWLWPDRAWRGVDLAGKTLGLVGFGRIGKAMARRGGGFGMRRLVCDPYVPHDTDGWGDFEFAPLARVIEQADFLSLHCVLTPETRNILSAGAIGQMKSSAIVVNVSRGALIDQAALIDALANGRLAGAGLDVFVEEPLDRDHPLHRLENVLHSPHLAFYTAEAYERLEQQCYAAVRDLLAGKMPPNVKNTAMLDARAESASTSQIPGKDQPRETEDWHWTEGDINLSPQREKWLEKQIDAPTRELLDRDARVFLHQSLSTPCLNALSECEGSYLIDEQGRRYLDFHGNSAHQIGYRHPRVIAAIKKQLDTLPFCPRRFTNRPAIELAEKLGELAPGSLSKVLLAPGGTSAIGIALKIARYATGRYKTISMWDSFHGASLDAISIGGEEFFRGGLGPLLPGCFHVDWPRAQADADAIEKILIEQDDVAAVIAEPMRCTTVDRPPDAYWKRVRELCDQHGALLIFDEIPTALGRTGRWFSCENAGVTPDLLVIGKGLGGGVMPMAAVIARDDLDVVADRALGHYTHEKSTTGAAAALATIEVIESDNLLKRARELGEHALGRLERMEEELAIVSDARGLGLALALELACNPEQGQQVLYACLEQGLSFKVSSGNVLTLTPPLTISRDEMDRALDVVESAVAQLGNRDGA